MIYPAATVASDNHIGEGVLLAAGARVNTNITLGPHVHLNVNAVVSHDRVISENTNLWPGSLVNGDTQTGTRVFLGTGTIIASVITVGGPETTCAGRALRS